MPRYLLIYLKYLLYLSIYHELEFKCEHPASKTKYQFSWKIWGKEHLKKKTKKRRQIKRKRQIDREREIDSEREIDRDR